MVKGMHLFYNDQQVVTLLGTYSASTQFEDFVLYVLWLIFNNSNSTDGLNLDHEWLNDNVSDT